MSLFKEHFIGCIALLFIAGLQSLVNAQEQPPDANRIQSASPGFEVGRSLFSSENITPRVIKGPAQQGPAQHVTEKSGASDAQMHEGWLGRLESAAIRTRTPGGRWARIEYDFDNRGFNVLNVTGASKLPFGWSFFGFVDFEGTDLTTATRSELSRFFLELDLKRKLWKHGGVIAELNDLQGDGNEVGRIGLFHNLAWAGLSPKEGLWAGKGRVGFKLLPLDTDGSGQVSVNYNRSFSNWLDGRFSLGGFLDVNYDVPGRGVVVVSEHQIRLRMVEGLHLITEFRYNGFVGDTFGIAPGFQYRF